MLITSDLEMIQEVFIKQFNAFPSRKRFPLTEPENSEYKNLLETNLPGRWKRMRLLMNPSFSSAKIRDMDPLIIKCTDRLIEQFENKSEEEVYINMFMKRFTMDTILLYFMLSHVRFIHSKINPLDIFKDFFLLSFI